MTKAKPETLAVQEMPKNLKDRLKLKLKNV
jgi:hypothetical protein